MKTIEMTVVSLRQITVPRYFLTERGFVTEFYCNLKQQLKDTDLFPQHTILETEVQKRHAEHFGIRQRPDLLIHIPIETGLTKIVNENNFVIYFFKLVGKGVEAKVKRDFDKLEKLFDRLNYKIGIIIIIGAYPKSYLRTYDGNFKDRIHELSISSKNNEILILHSYFYNDKFKTEEK